MRVTGPCVSTIACPQTAAWAARRAGAAARAEDVRWLADSGATMGDVLRRMGFPTPEALYVFCCRRNMRDVWRNLPRITTPSPKRGSDGRFVAAVCK